MIYFFTCLFIYLYFIAFIHFRWLSGSRFDAAGRKTFPSAFRCIDGARKRWIFHPEKRMDAVADNLRHLQFIEQSFMTTLFRSYNNCNNNNHQKRKKKEQEKDNRNIQYSAQLFRFKLSTRRFIGCWPSIY